MRWTQGLPTLPSLSLVFQLFFQQNTFEYFFLFNNFNWGRLLRPTPNLLWTLFLKYFCRSTKLSWLQFLHVSFHEYGQMTLTKWLRESLKEVPQPTATLLDSASWRTLFLLPFPQTYRPVVFLMCLGQTTSPDDSLPSNGKVLKLYLVWLI